MPEISVENKLITKLNLTFPVKNEQQKNPIWNSSTDYDVTSKLHLFLDICPTNVNAESFSPSQARGERPKRVKPLEMTIQLIWFRKNCQIQPISHGQRLIGVNFGLFDPFLPVSSIDDLLKTHEFRGNQPLTTDKW